jgi:protein involved in polysaccharide export with SLBB domain
MDAQRKQLVGCCGLAAAFACLLASGCHSTRMACRTDDCRDECRDDCPDDCPEKTIHRISPEYNCMPRELDKVVMPQYVIEPPDILTIQLLDAVPKAPYRLKTLDLITVQVAGTLPDAPIAGIYPIEPGGLVNLGAPYGGVAVAGMSTEEAQAAISAHLKTFLREPEVSVALAELSAAQQLVGEFLVGPDGTVTLGSYGSVPVVGLTIPQAKEVIEKHLGGFLESPVISINVYAYNSKVFYVIMQGGGMGDGIYRMSLTGNETVLDALSQVNGLEQVSSKKIWIARPTRDSNHVHILPVDYLAITEHASATSNYQILPGDRVFVAEDKLVAFDSQLAKILTPLERLMGFTLLGTATTTRLSGHVLKGGGNPGNANINNNTGVVTP